MIITETFIRQLSNRYALGLPGREHQMKMAVLSRYKSMDTPPSARQACVLLLLFPKANEWHILLTERTSNTNPNSRHSGQISFPGGRLEPEDDSLAACALRETYEEVGIPPEIVNIIGPLTELYIPVSNFQVFPFLAWTHYTPQYMRQETEVQSIIEAPLSIFKDVENMKTTDIRVNESLILTDVPYYHFKGHVIWGATAMILSEFMQLLEETI